jgi:ribosomal protein S18 acetylase RimI-like enzyme
MDKSIIVRKLTIDDLEQYKETRLELLKKEPANFGSSFEEESKSDEVMWQNRLNKNYLAVFGGFINGKIIGIALAVMNPRKKIKHIATLNSMYVKEKYRKLGLGKEMIICIIKYLSNQGVEILNLSVVTSNEKAINLYKSLGFEIYGEEKNAIKLNNEYINLFLMTKNI